MFYCVQVSETAGSEPAGAAAGQGAGAGAGAGKPGKKPRTVPTNAAAMHPCMLLTYLRPNLEYRELDAHGDKPQQMTYTVGVTVDGKVYTGQGNHSACCTLFHPGSCLYQARFTLQLRKKLQVKDAI